MKTPNAFQVFDFERTSVRVLTVNGEPHFVAMDLCRALGVANSRMALSRLSESNKGVSTVDTPGGPQEVGIVNESGMYKLVLTGRTEAAKRFEDWVTSEVLPSIRKTGQYSVGQTDAVTLPTTFAQALRLAADQAELLEKQGKQLEHAKPAVEFVERYTMASSGSKGFREVCKLLKVKEPEFRDWLIESRIMYRLDGVLTPFAVHHTAGRFEVKAGEANSHAYNHAKFTPKGVAWVANLWSNRRGAQKALSL